MTDEQYNDFEERTVSLGKSFKTKKALGMTSSVVLQRITELTPRAETNLI